jgi:hypothetical protein
MSIIINQIDIHANDLTINYGIPNPISFPKGGIYKISQNITLKAIYNATIFYNTDKSSVYNTYTDTILINNSSTLNFYAVYNNIKSQLSTENYTILSPLVATPNEGTYSVPQNITLKAFSDDALIYYSTDNLDIQQYKGSINISSNDTITAFYSYKGVKSENTIFSYTISGFDNDYEIDGQSSFSITSDFKGGSVYGQQYFTKIFNLNRLQYNFRIGLYSGFFTKNNILNNMKSKPSQLDKENFLKAHMKCIYRDKGNKNNLFQPTDIDINQWQNNFCLYKGVKGSPCRCYNIFPDACHRSYPPDQTYTTLDKALDTVIDGGTANLSQSIEGGPLISPIATPSITNLPNYIYEATNNYYHNYINNNYWSFNGQQLESNNNSYGLCLLSNKILTLPCGLVFDDTNQGDNYLGLVNYSNDLINNIKETTKALTHTYYINSQNYKGYTNCILPSFFELDDKYGFDNNDSMQYKPIEGNGQYNMEINSFSGIEYKGIIKIPKLFMPKGNDIELLRDVYAMNNNLYNKNNIDTYYTNNSSGVYYVPFNYKGTPFDGMYSIYNNENSAILKWENSKQEISEYWKLNDAGDKYIAVDSTEVDPNLVNYEFPKYNLPFNYTKSPDYIEYTKSISVNITDMYDRNIKISYQWVRFIDQITIRKYKDKLLKDNTNEDVDTYLNNLQTKIENLHKENPPESSFYPQTDLKSDQLVKLLDVQLVDPPSEFSYGYVAEVYEMIYSE